MATIWKQSFTGTDFRRRRGIFRGPRPRWQSVPLKLANTLSHEDTCAGRHSLVEAGTALWKPGERHHTDRQASFNSSLAVVLTSRPSDSAETAAPSTMAITRSAVRSRCKWASTRATAALSRDRPVR